MEWVALTGQVVAHASFSTPQLSAFTNAATFPQPAAHLSAGVIFYVDAQGMVRSLARDGTSASVTTLQLRSGQNLVSFAVSPDGHSLAASILNYPPRHSPPPNSLTDPFLEPGDWWYDYETASAGSAAQRVVSKDLGSFPNLGFPSGITTVYNWDGLGPVAITDTLLAQQFPPFSTITPGHGLVHLGPDGSHLEPLGGPGCIPLDEGADGHVVCYTSSSPTNPSGCVLRYDVNSTTGAVPWSAKFTGCVYNPRLSPSGDSFCTDSAEVYKSDGTTIKLPQTMPGTSYHPDSCLGWAGDSALVMWGNDSRTGQVYTYDLASNQRKNLFSSLGTVVFLGEGA